MDDINKELADQMRNLSDTIAASSHSTILQTEILKKLAAAQGVQVNNIKGIDKDFSNLKTSVGEQTAIYKANQKAAEDYAKAMSNFNAALTSGASGLTSLGTALLTTEKSFAKYNSALSSAGDAALSLGKNFGLVGIALGGLVKIATMAATAWTKQADATLKSTDELSKMGAAGALTANQVLDMGHNAGLTSQNLEVLTKSAARANSGLAGLGATVGDGTLAFGKMVAVTAEQRQAFQRLGVSQEELMNRQADYVKLQELSGKSLAGTAKDGDKLRKQSLEYAENLSRLSALTGKSADKLQEEQNAAQLEYEEIVATRIEDDKIRKLKAEGREAEAAGLQKEQDARKAYINQVTNTLGKEAGLQVARVARTGSFDEKTRGLANLGVTAQEVQAGYKGKTKEEAEAGAAQFSQGFKEKQSARLGQLGTALQYGGEALGSQFGLGKESLQETGKLMERNEVTANEEARKRTQGAAAGSATAGGAAAEDPAQKARNKLTEAEIAAQVGVDKLVQATNPLLNGFNGATTAATALALAAGAAAVALGVMAGGSILGKGKGLLGKMGKGAGGAAGAAEGALAGEASAASKEAGALSKMAGVAGKATKFLGGAGALLSVGLAAKEGYDKVSDINKERDAGLISKNEATVAKSQAVGSTAGSAVVGAGGAYAGAAAGAAIGSVVPVVGTVIGGLLGAAVGGWLGSKGGEYIGDKVGKIAGDKLKDDSPGADRVSLGLSEEDLKKQEEDAKKALQSEARNTIATDKGTKELTQNTVALINLTQALDDLTNIQTIQYQGGTEEEKQKRLEAIYARLGATGGRNAPATGGGGTSGGGTTPGAPISMGGGGAGTTPSDIAKALSANGITDTKSQANILAQVKGESGDFKPKSENLNYSPERLLQVFPGKVKSIEDAKRIVAGGPEAIGNLVYGGRMGNAADEGYKYRGRGLIGLTGKDNYAKFGKLVGVDLVKNPDLANDPEVAKKIVVAYFKEAQKKGTNLADINSVGKAVGYATGPAETAKRSGYATQFASGLGGGGTGPILASASSTSIPSSPDAKKALSPDKPTIPPAGTIVASNTTAPNTITPTSSQADPVVASLNDIKTMMSTKFDSMIDAINQGNNTNNKLLKVARA